MNDRNLQTIELARQFLGGPEPLEFRASSVGEKYNWIEKVMTRYEKLKSLPQAENHLRLSITSEGLNTVANQMSDNQSAERMVNARSNLFQQISRLLTGLPETLLFRLIFQLE